MDYNNQTLRDLTFYYFEIEKKINMMQEERVEFEKRITQQYAIKSNIYNLIKSKQIEEENKMKDISK
jgi:hypothetical protein